MMVGPRFLSVFIIMKFSLERSWLMVFDCTLVIFVERLWLDDFRVSSCDKSDLNWQRRTSISGLACGGCQDLLLMYSFTTNLLPVFVCI